MINYSIYESAIYTPSELEQRNYNDRCFRGSGLRFGYYAAYFYAKRKKGGGINTLSSVRESAEFDS